MPPLPAARAPPELDEGALLPPVAATPPLPAAAIGCAGFGVPAVAGCIVGVVAAPLLPLSAAVAGLSAAGAGDSALEHPNKHTLSQKM